MTKLVNMKRKTIYPIFNEDNAKILLFADSHIGSRYGLLDPDAQTKDGSKVNPNETQLAIWNQLQTIISGLPEVDVVLLGGDICEGTQYRQAGIGMVTTDTSLQATWGADIIDDICKKVKPSVIVGVQGTGYHVTNYVGGDLDWEVGQHLADRGYKVYFGVSGNVKIGETLWNIKHAFPRATVNRLVPLEKIFRFIARDYAAGRLKQIPDVFVRAHIHICMGPVRIEQRTYGIVAPCLKELDPYLEGKDYTWEPDLGVMLLHQRGKILDGELKRIVL